MLHILVVEENTDMMDKEYIDLIVADIMMPGMDGYALIKALREAKSETDERTVNTLDGTVSPKVPS